MTQGQIATRFQQFYVHTFVGCSPYSDISCSQLAVNWGLIRLDLQVMSYSHGVRVECTISSNTPSHVLDAFRVRYDRTALHNIRLSSNIPIRSWCQHLFTGGTFIPRCTTHYLIPYSCVAHNHRPAVEYAIEAIKVFCQT